MEQFYGTKQAIYQSININPKSNLNKPEHIYLDPELVTKKNKSNNEKHAVQVIMEKYDSLRCLDTQIDNLHISSDSGDSIAKDSLDDDSCRQDDLSDDCDNSVFDNGEITELEMSQIEAFFQSHKTYVSVCHCLANLYFATSDGNSSAQEWELARTGVPVLLLDKGDTKARNKRMLQIALAEKGSGFVLWKDIIDNLSNYSVQESTTFHTMYLSSDHRKMAGLSFDHIDAAEDFLKEVERLTSDPLNISLSVPKSKKKQKTPKKKEKIIKPRKCDISSPCCFQHVTSVALNDKKKLFSMATLVTPSQNTEY